VSYYCCYNGSCGDGAGGQGVSVVFSFAISFCLLLEFGNLFV
jgi:hypothetical protein